MDRRAFVLGAPVAVLATQATAQNRSSIASSLTNSQRARLAVTTVSLRHNLQPPLGSPSKVGPMMDLASAPRVIRDRLGLNQVEVWSLQFQDKSLDYCRRLRSVAEAAGSRFINVQLDDNYDLSAGDSARREQSVALVKTWMDRAAALGAPSLRANIDAGKADSPLQVEPATESFRKLAEYGRKIGVKILIENHIGASAKADNCLALLKAVNDPFCRAIVDWGNSAATTEAGRIADLSKLFPYLQLVSAKGLHFDAAGKHLEYAFEPIVRATEAAGYRGIYSIELFAEPDGPEDAFQACETMIRAIAPALRA